MEDDPDPSEWANLAGYEEIIATTIQEVEGDPKSVQEAQYRSDWPHWKEAMDREIGSLEHAGTWTTCYDRRFLFLDDSSIPM